MPLYTFTLIENVRCAPTLKYHPNFGLFNDRTCHVRGYCACTHLSTCVYLHSHQKQCLFNENDTTQDGLWESRTAAKAKRTVQKLHAHTKNGRALRSQRRSAGACSPVLLRKICQQPILSHRIACARGGLDWKNLLYLLSAHFACQKVLRSASSRRCGTAHSEERELCALTCRTRIQCIIHGLHKLFTYRMHAWCARARVEEFCQINLCRSARWSAI